MEPEKKSNGALVGLVIIIIILIIGGIYIGQSNKKAVNNQNIQGESVTTEDSAELDSLEEESAATEIDVGANVIDSVQ